jgi:hypothetical protein
MILRFTTDLAVGFTANQAERDTRPISANKVLWGRIMMRCYDVFIMRTTLNLDDDVMDAAKAIAASQRRSLGQVVSELARRGLAPSETRISDEAGFPVFAVRDGAPLITGEMVDSALDET